CQASCWDCCMATSRCSRCSPACSSRFASTNIPTPASSRMSAPWSRRWPSTAAARAPIPIPIRAGVKRGAGFLRSGRRKLEAEAFEARCDALGDQADLAQVAHQAVMHVAAEVLAEGGLVAAGRALAAEPLDLVELGLAAAELLVEREPKGAGQ